MEGYPFSDESEITPELLYAAITEDDPYSSWESWPGYEGKHTGFSQHGDDHIIYINEIIADALPLESAEIPVGGIIVKENFSDAEGLIALTVMVKLEGFDEESGNWYWGKFTLQDGEKVCGKIEDCISCHVSMKQNDYLMVYDLDGEN